MPISIVGDSRRRRGGSFVSRETLTQSTATGQQLLNNSVDQHFVGMGTATGHTVNRYRVSTTTDPLPHEGQVMDILATATGEAKLDWNFSTATGAWVLTADGDYLQIKFIGDVWRVMVNSGCTNATAGY